ncbi:MAG: type III-A CRISPR-associated protein Csm2 [Candidatus Riflebacteria bacterium]|nr:type III-A CRISPR-associated protein Csm2 [Candidatus Riflebacteria bacterium]
MAIQFWQDKDRTQLNPTLFSEIAEAEAKKVFRSAEGRGKNINKNKPTQLRRFFDEIIAFESRYKQMLSKNPGEPEKVFMQQLPFIHMLIPKVKYAEARNLVSRDFVELVKSAVVDNLKQSSDLKVLTSFFEAFMGHYKYCVEIESMENQSNDRNRGRY